MARTMHIVAGVALFVSAQHTALADDTQRFSTQRTENWVQPRLDGSAGIQRNGDGTVIGEARQWTWRASYDINHTEDVVKISQTFELDAATGSAAIGDAELGGWETAMEGVWDQLNSDWRIRCTDLTTGVNVDYKIAYDAQLWREGEGPGNGQTSMYDITVSDGPGGSNALNWFRTSNGTGTGVNDAGFNVVGHEAGHYLGLPDEYFAGNANELSPGWVDPAAGPDVLKAAFAGDGIMNNTSTTTGVAIYDRYFYAWIVGLVTADTSRGIDPATRSYAAVMIPAPAGVLVLIASAALATTRRRAG